MGSDTARGTFLTIAQTLKSEIKAGAIAQGTAMPSESVLVKRFGVARETVRKALLELEVEGLVTTRPGKGRYVGDHLTGPADVVKTLREELAGGSFTPGDRFSSEADLRLRFGLGRYAARQVLAELEADGLIVTRPGRGRYVADATEGES